MSDTGRPAASTPQAGPAGEAVSPWFGAIGLLVLATLLAAAFVQARQHALLNLTARFQQDYAVVNLYQLELEYLRLRNALQAQQSQPRRQALQLRYEIFVSRVDLLAAHRQRHTMAADNPTHATVALLQAFIAQADSYFSAGLDQPLSPQAVQLLLEGLQPLEKPLHQLMLTASHQVAQQTSERQARVRQHNLVGMGLTAFLSCMVLVFAAIALRQLRAAHERHQRLVRLADELHEARIEAEMANQAKSDFLADMSHELRTPLHGLMGMQSLLKEAPQHPQAAAWLATADDSAQHLLSLLDDILDLSKLESGSLELQPQVVSLETLLREVQALMQPAAHAKGLGLALEVEPGLPAWVQLDPTRVRQVLYNLLNNAVKFSITGTVLLRCRQYLGTPAPTASTGMPQSRAAEVPWLCMDVIDTGVGLDADTASRLFRRFSRADDARTRHQAGAGLGLAISRNLARLMGGELSLRSTLGTGSAFSLRIPVVPALPPDHVGAAAQGSQLLPFAPPGQVAAQRRLRVLVADDHPVNRLVLHALLERLGHTCCMADNGFEAVQLVQQERVDLVLMDVHMPVMDGIAATRTIRALPAPAGQVVLVALTADVFADTRVRCLEAGADEVLTKPLSLDNLRALMARRFDLPLPEPEDPAAAEPADQPPLLDRAMQANVLELMGRGPGISLYAGFFDQAHDALRRMRSAVANQDPEGLKRSAHAVKGAALNLGLNRLADAADDLSRIALQARAADLAQPVQAYAQVLEASQRLCAEQGLLPAGAPGPAGATSEPLPPALS